ncbi:hypothetical protein K474DRAFT_1707092 [Panus rudis PR-1116 ss-1]|nr:hypothetical protein K474DRAFT_1707092 [Panus rudis PR-1116 ss-1]
MHSSGTLSPHPRSEPRSQMHSVAAFAAAAQAIVSGPIPGRSQYTSLNQALRPSADPSAGRQGSPGQPVQPQPTFAPQMASDGRYMYQASQESVPPPYAYTYAGGPYEQSYASSQQRPVRNGSGPTQSPHQPASSQPPYNPPPQAYPPQATYAPPNFAVPQSSNPPQWPAEGWPPFPTQYVQHNPQTRDSQQHSGNGRPETAPAQPSDQRVPSAPPKADTSREERPPRSTDTVSKNKSRRAREREPDPVPPPAQPAPSVTNSPSAPPPIPFGLDFAKLLESYNLIITSSNTFLNDLAQGQLHPSAENVERMLEAAKYGAQALESALNRAAQEPPQEPVERTAPKEEDKPPTATVPAADQPPQEGSQTCLGCNATSTPEWRRGPMGPRTLCNACGLVYAKLIKKRTRDPGRTQGRSSKAGKGSRNDAGHVSSGSDDDDSYGSQEHPSDAGEIGGRD